MRLTHAPFYYNLDKVAIVEFLESQNSAIFYMPIPHEKEVIEGRLITDDCFDAFSRDIQNQLEKYGFIRVHHLFFNKSKLMNFCYQKGGINFTLDNGKEYFIKDTFVENFYELFD